jgi:hypothetical protein
VSVRKQLAVLEAAVAATVSISLLTASPAMAATTAPVAVSGVISFGAGCNGPAPQPGTLFLKGEVEPFVATNRANPANLAAVWQQDRWSNGGAQGLLTGVSVDGGQTWAPAASPPWTRCAGGTPANGGDYERASDPWVSFGPTGTAYQMALGLNASDEDPDLLNPTDAMLVSRSTDGGRTWGPITTLIRDTSPMRLNDKNSLTADPTDARYAYAVWDRLELLDPAGQTYTGPTLFSRTTDGGATWETPRQIFTPGLNSQSIGNQITVLPGGKLVNVFTYINQGTPYVAVITSTDKGATWSAPTLISIAGSTGVTDPRDRADIRTGDIIPDIAVDPRPNTNTLYVVWQESRFTRPLREQVAIARSTDGGATWSAPRRVSERADVQAFLPTVDVDGSGTVAVGYYDFTNDSRRTTPLLTDVWVARSSDGATSFAARERQTPSSFDYRVAPLTGSGYFIGDYNGLDHASGGFTAVFGVARTASDPSGIVSTRVSGPVGAGVGGGGAGGAGGAQVLFGAKTLFASRFTIVGYVD